MPARVLLQDFTGVPGRGRSGRDARRHGAHGRRREKDQSAAARRTRDRSFRAGGPVRQRTWPSHSTPNSNFSATSSATDSCAGDRSAFANFQVVPPDTGIVHQVNLEYLARVVFDAARGRPHAGLSGFAGRHRFAHHDGQRPGRFRLGRRRNRSGSRHARPAALDADSRRGRLQTARPPRPKARRPPISCSRSPRCCARKASSASSSNSTARAFPA